ncbi:DNA-3-methyladenine glycosylase [Aquamicrobium sp. LC103]|uniref:DNA-3-methyladenine glycosylase n=1 Tax=Aquamicrobium sp. LC103 TaxID=1120658 RepID=UPI00063E9CE1|nr:DNA-3-methyladenine glycosylase [Aquamicrobium sp. LC103]TKT69721.1 DNA-3-methyladenine glycosylase [Aquamicrobium sp. LC103]
MSLAQFFSRPAVIVARELIGAEFRVNGVGGVIVETEAYEPDDPASHSYGGPRVRNRAMFGPPAHAYVYRSYGIHWCMNAVCLPGSAVLIRALEPRWDMARMELRRGATRPRLLCSGPGRLCQALGIDGTMDALHLGRAPFVLVPAATPPRLVAGPRIGISRATEKPWRFGLAGSTFVSSRFPLDVT